jgi:hypothetical protein
MDEGPGASRRWAPAIHPHEEAVMYTNGQTAAGVAVPDTKLARDATELVRE